MHSVLRRGPPEREGRGRRGRGRRERIACSGGPHVFKLLKNVTTYKQKTKLNSVCTIKFFLRNTSKQDVT
jgi:hypothetical protein